jgi:hypothetical protein
VIGFVKLSGSGVSSAHGTCDVRGLKERNERCFDVALVGGVETWFSSSGGGSGEFTHDE